MGSTSEQKRVPYCGIFGEFCNGFGEEGRLDEETLVGIKSGDVVAGADCEFDDWRLEIAGLVSDMALDMLYCGSSLTRGM